MLKAPDSKEIDMLCEAARKDFISFCAFVKPDFRPQRFHEIIWEHLQAVYTWEIKRLRVSMPPQHGKSTLCTILYPAWVLGKKASERFIVSSYGWNLSEIFSGQCQDVMWSPAYGMIFNTKIKTKPKNHWTVLWWGYYHAVGVDWPTTGISMDTGIIDDPIKTRREAESATYRENVWRWFTNQLLTRQQWWAGKIISIMTRWHIDDLAWRLDALEEWGWEKWTKLVFPAYDEKRIALRPSKFDFSFLETQKNSLWVRDFAALYLQDPIASSGNIFTPDTFRYFLLSDFETVIGMRKQDFIMGIFVDPAFSTNKNSDDAVVIVALKNKINNDIYILDIYSETSAPSKTYSAIFNMADKWAYWWWGMNIDFISIETVNLSSNQTEFLKWFKEEMRVRNKFYNVYEYNPTGYGKKEDRIKFHLEPRFSTWTIFFRKDDPSIYQWKKLEEQLLLFPHWNHDDIIDALSQCVSVFQSKWANYKEQNRNQKPEQKSLITWKTFEQKMTWFVI